MRLLRIRTDQFLESMMESARAADIAPFLASVHAFAEAEPLDLEVRSLSLCHVWDVTLRGAQRTPEEGERPRPKGAVFFVFL